MASMAAPIGMAAGLAGGIIGAIGSGPSSAMVALNNQVQNFSKSMLSQAKTEGLDASTTFNNLMQPLQRIVQGGPQQAGWSNAQTTAYNAQVTNDAAAKARDLGAVGTGGTTPGAQDARVLAAKQAAEDARASGIASGTQESFKEGRENFFQAANEEKDLPSVFATANTANSEAGTELTAAEKSQQNIDTAKRSASWQGMLSKGLSAVGGAAVAGAGNTSSDSSFGENVGNIFNAGANGGKGTMPSIPGLPTGSSSNDVEGGGVS